MVYSSKTALPGEALDIISAAGAGGCGLGHN